MNFQTYVKQEFMYYESSTLMLAKSFCTYPGLLEPC